MSPYAVILIIAVIALGFVAWLAYNHRAGKLLDKAADVAIADAANAFVASKASVAQAVSKVGSEVAKAIDPKP